MNSTNNNNTSNNNNNRDACNVASCRLDADKVCEVASNHIEGDFLTGLIPSENDIEDLCTTSCRSLEADVFSACDDHVSYLS